MKRLSASTALVLLVIGCSSPAPISSQAQVSVVCEFFAVDGPNDDLQTAAIAPSNSGTGYGATASRIAREKIEQLAERAAGEEREDLLTLASVVDTSLTSGEGYVGWSGAHNSFLVKYAVQCGYPLAE